ncbi:methyl-accepting chemotaxis protein [Gammaproteobacteria bacterium]
MALTASERGWLPWLGKTGKLAMGWSSFLNRHTYGVVEHTFEGIADTRKEILTHWVTGHWDYLQRLALMISSEFSNISAAVLLDRRKHAPDFSELYVTNAQGKILASTHALHVGRQDTNPRAHSEGLKAPFLLGPYSDPETLVLGPSVSKFHDAVTLMFYQPISLGGQTLGCLCGRIPNDVMSDLIQREAGHVYRDSGDNYLFMVESRFDPTIKPGTALSRSRFEDDSFSLGDNLKQGVRTDFGVVRVAKHTELELIFTDPATRALHPGVRETIRRGENIFVTYPAYSDYRHVPVIGKGITFQLPGSSDRWGMMCEADLEEVYRRRSINYKLMRLALLVGGSIWFALNVLWYQVHLDEYTMQAIIVGLLAIGAATFYTVGLNPIIRRLETMTKFFLQVAECGATLKNRIDLDSFHADESGELGRWINSFVDKMDDTVDRVLVVAGQVSNSSADLVQISAQVADGSHRQSISAQSTASNVEQLTATIQRVAEQVENTHSISTRASNLSREGYEVVQRASNEMIKIAESVNHSSKLISQLGERSGEISGIVRVIKDIAEQTNLLALNAAIEAARAGEQGRGFAVVADEVRSLAERTAKSTAEITRMISAIQNETRQAVTNMEQCSSQAQEGVKLATKAADSLGQINQGANETLQMVRSIADATREQNSAGQEIVRNVEGIAAMAKQNNISVIRSSASAHNLEQFAADLQNAVSKFTV